MLQSLDMYHLEGIYIRNDTQLTALSQKVCGYWDVITCAIEQDKRKVVPQKKKETDEKYQERIVDIVRSTRSFNIKYIDECLQNMGESGRIVDYFSQLGAVKNDSTLRENLFDQINNAYTAVEDILDHAPSDNQRLA